MGERTEALMRIVVGIISGIIIGLWASIIEILAVIHGVYVLFAGKRSKSIADFSNMLITELYHFYRYMYFTTNKRPFPFRDLTKQRDSIELGKKKR